MIFSRIWGRKGVVLWRHAGLLSARYKEASPCRNTENTRCHDETVVFKMCHEVGEKSSRGDGVNGVRTGDLAQRVTL